MTRHIPNGLTVFRILLIPVLVVLYFWKGLPNRELLVAGVFVVAAVTDWLDGFLARVMGVTTKLGEFLDPVADKLIVSTALVLLVSDEAVLERVFLPMAFATAVCIIVGREIVISALREWMAELGERGVVKVGPLGKVKTGFQMVSIALLLYAEPLHGLPLFTAGLPVFKIGEVAFYIAAGLTLWSMWAYLRAAMPYLLEKTRPRPPAGAAIGAEMGAENDQKSG